VVAHSKWSCYVVGHGASVRVFRLLPTVPGWAGRFYRGGSRPDVVFRCDPPDGAAFAADLNRQTAREKLHPHQVELYRIGCVGSGLVLAKALTNSKQVNHSIR